MPIKNKTKMQWLMDYCKRANLYVYTYSPGDGITRYKFSKDADSDYFGCQSYYVVLGFKEAEIFATGFLEGYFSVIENGGS